MSLLGETGFKKLAMLNHGEAVAASEKIDAIEGVRVVNETFFNEFTVELPVKAEQAVERLAERNILGGIPVSRLLPEHAEFDNLLLVTVTETNTEEEVDQLVDALKEIANA